MKSSKLTDAQKAFIFKQSTDISEAPYFNWKKYGGLPQGDLRLKL